MPPGLRLSDVKKHLAKVATNRRPESPIDVYVSSSTGHQIREADAATEGGWQAGRTSKLKSQFSINGPVAGVKRKADEVVRESKRPASSSAVNNSNATLDSYFVTNDPTQTTQTQTHATSTDTMPKLIFESCTIFVNGTTGAAGVSDIELKKILSSHGAVVSYYLARRQITHVILTDPAATAPALLLESQRPTTHTPTPSSSSSSSSSSPSPSVVSSGPTVLAGRKVELEMKARNPTKIHYVSVEWVLESVKQGKRLAETKFPAAPLRQAKQVTLMNCKKVKPRQQSLKNMVPSR